MHRFSIFTLPDAYVRISKRFLKVMSSKLNPEIHTYQIKSDFGRNIFEQKNLKIMSSKVL